jgi:homoserine kinase type II
MVSGPALEAPAGLLARWGIPADVLLIPAERGCNNQTFTVAHGGRRWVLRISQNLSAAQARAEHRLLGRLRTAGLPFGVPEPVAALSGDTVAETPAGPATLCRWIPGVRPELAAEPALERFGRAIGLLSLALRPVAWSDAPQDWRGDPLRAHPDAPRAGELARALRGAGVPPARVRRLEAAADGVEARAAAADAGLPVQLVHGDLGASNALVDERTGEMTGVLDFELAGPDARVQDLLVGLLLSGALAGPGWARRTAALARGYAAVLRPGQAEIMAVPDLLVLRCVGSVFWRAGRWRRGQSSLSDVADRMAVLEATETWLAVHRGQLLSVLAAAGAQRP